VSDQLKRSLNFVVDSFLLHVVLQALIRSQSKVFMPWMEDKHVDASGYGGMTRLLLKSAVTFFPRPVVKLNDGDGDVHGAGLRNQ
jgi:hypothetical protein